MTAVQADPATGSRQDAQADELEAIKLTNTRLREERSERECSLNATPPARISMRAVGTASEAIR